MLLNKLIRRQYWGLGEIFFTTKDAKVGVSRFVALIFVSFASFVVKICSCFCTSLSVTREQAPC